MIFASWGGLEAKRQLADVDKHVQVMVQSSWLATSRSLSDVTSKGGPMPNDDH